MEKATVGVLGIGEVGSSISSIFAKKFKVLKKDLNFDQIKNSKLDVLHVCIPYDDNFVKNVTSQIKKNKPSLTVIHSTVKPGTTNNLFKKTKVLIVHSPVMGTHPNLKNDLLLFTKIIGPQNKKAAQAAQNHFRQAKIKTVLFKSPTESELAKLLDTTYFAWNILFNKYVKKMCDDLDLDFDNVYVKFNQIYNRGYKKIRPNVTRPVLNYMDGPIGGHCVVPNTQILDKFFPSGITSFIIDYDKNLKGS